MSDEVEDGYAAAAEASSLTASPTLQRLQEAVPLFAQPGRVARRVVGCAGVTRTPGGASLDLLVEGGGRAHLRVEATRSGSLHLQWRCPAEAPLPVSEHDGMLGEGAAADAGAEVVADSAQVIVTTAQARFTLDPATLSWTLSRPDGTLRTRQRSDEADFTTRLAEPLGTSGGEGLRTWSHESFALRPDERFYGLGQQFTALQRRGARTVLWNQDAMGCNASPVTYHGTPFLWSSAGWGVVVHSGGRVAFEVGTPMHDTLTVAAEGGVLDIHLLVADSPREMLRSFYALAGPVPSIPAWALGIWMSRCMYDTAAQVEEVVERLDAVGMPYDVVNLDPRWMHVHRDFDGRLGSDFRWNEAGFGDPRAFMAAMSQRALRVCLWENPHPFPGTPTWSRLEAAQGLAGDDGGGVAWSPEAAGCGAIVDFTSPDAVREWSAAHAELIGLGAAAFKTDFGEAVPDAARFADGRSGTDIHNLYALLYNRATAEAMRDAGVEEPVVFARSGWLGSHRHPVHWSGDARSTWEDMRGALRSGLSAALSGLGFWGSDIGGFYQPGWGVPDDELYARWAWLGCLSAVARFHGTSPREPYAFAAEARDAAVAAARLRYALLPYLVAQQPRGRVDDLPLMRPLMLGWPEHPEVYDEATEYLLGDNLLAAPVLEPGGRRRVWLPPGEWGDWWTGEVRSGPTHVEVAVPLDRCPIWQRAGTAIPLAVAPARRAGEAMRAPRRHKRHDEPYPPPS